VVASPALIAEAIDATATAAEPNMQDITNYVQLTDLVGTSGQPTEQQFKAIADAGFTAVINLAMPDSDKAIPEEGSIVTGLGMSYVHIPVPFDAPSCAHLKQFSGAMQAFDGQRVWVHCVVNARVSAFMYQYLTKVKGLPEAESRSPILDRWEPDMDEVWRNFLAMPAAEFIS
jgi:protein tyrosine phosphatase (PTP) superfamily phosphohydrolase (DUF442 family)